MFYVKKVLGNDAKITIEITDENVFCRCPKCGCEVQTDLVEALKDCGDLFGTSIYCAACSKDIKGDE